MIMLLLPGTPVTYNGEEMGMEDTDVSWEQTKDTVGINAGPMKYKLFSRDPERTPMQWNAGMNAGLYNQTQKNANTGKSEAAFPSSIQLNLNYANFSIVYSP